jgi:hypothetical protein
MRKLIIISIIITVLISGIGCGSLFWRDVECYDISEDLKLFPGNVQDSIVLSDKNGNKTTLKIIKKNAEHITGYITDTGCSCYDYWRIEISGSGISFIFATELQYIESTEGTRYEDLVLKKSSAETKFTEVNKKVYNNYNFDGITIQNVIEYRISTISSNEYSTVYLAKNIGIVRLITGNGNILTNINLTASMNSGIGTWEYTESKCE